MKNLKPSKLFTLLLLSLIVAVLGMISKSEKRGEGKTAPNTIIPLAQADAPGGSCGGSANSGSCTGTAGGTAGGSESDNN